MSRALRVVLASALLSASAAQAEVVFGISVPGVAATNLVTFDTTNVGMVTTIGALTGIVQGHTMRAVDFRPSNGQLYAVSTSGTAAQLYTVDLATAVLTAVGGGFVLNGNASTRVSIDFNPVVDAIRVVTGSGQNYRVNANTGALIAQDTSITTVGSGAVPQISGIAYTNNLAGAASTTLYAYDFLLDNVGTISPPNSGAFNIVGNSGFVAGDAGAGFDISGATGIAYLSVDDFTASPGFNAEFFSLNLATGVASQIGPDDFHPLLDFSVQPRDNGRVPLPASVALLLGGLMMLGATPRRRRD